MTMQIFYINWQQHWEYDWTMNIGANAHGKRTVSTKQHNWQTWQLSFQWYRRGIELVFKSLDCFTMRLFHSATIFFPIHLYLLFGTSPGWLVGWRIFFFFLGGGGGDGGLTSIWWGISMSQTSLLYSGLIVSGTLIVTSVILPELPQGSSFAKMDQC